MTPFPDVLILAGGDGTRARAYLGRTSKALAPVGRAGHKLIDILLDQLNAVGARRIFFLMVETQNAAVLQAHLANHPTAPRHVYLIEPAPAGTAGALRAALKTIPAGLTDPLMVLNHDTLLPGVDLKEVVFTNGNGHATALDVRSLSGTPVGVRIFSRTILAALAVSPARNLEDVEGLRYRVYRVADNAFIDVGTEPGFARAQALP